MAVLTRPTIALSVLLCASVLSAERAQSVERLQSGTAFYMGTEYDPRPGAALQKMIQDARNVPPEILERARASVRR
jgi:hypothetical protein